MDEFEQYLKQQPLRSVPTSWRREILGGTGVSPVSAEAPTTRTGGTPVPLPGAAWWIEWLWPSPVAWAAVGACWVIIIGLQLAARPADHQMAKPATPVEITVALAEQRRLLSELTGPAVVMKDRRARSEPGPRSELRRGYDVAALLRTAESVDQHGNLRFAEAQLQRTEPYA